VYLDPDDPDEMIYSAPPPLDAAYYTALSERIPFTVSSLVKIAKASDPRTSSFVVNPDSKGNLFIRGLVDQGNRYHEFVNFDADQAPERLGLIQASIIGIGHVVAYDGYARIAELNVDMLIRESHDVLRYGPVRDKLKESIEKFIDTVMQEQRRGIERTDAWRNRLSEEWIATICRLLLRIRNYRHGGALLITPDKTWTGLNLKYQISYTRLRKALRHRADFLIKRSSALNRLVDSMTPESEMTSYGDYMTISYGSFIEQHDAEEHFRASSSELDGAIWFVSLLSRVDGLVLLSTDLDVRGFGVEILNDQAPLRVVRSTTATATERSLQPVDYQHFGTRHRSMMRYCYSVPESIGFVVSQDGDVRVMTRVNEELIVWDSIRLQVDDFIRARSSEAIATVRSSPAA
jgi:hypothetical protein